MFTFIDVKFIFRVVQLRKYCLNSRCRPSSCLPAVLPMLLVIISLLKRVKCPPFLFSQPKQFNLVPSSSRLTVH